MSTQAERLVRIESADGRRHYSMSEAAFKHMKHEHLDGQTYEAAGYKVVSYEDGTAYEAGNEPTKYGIHAAALSPEIGAVEEEKPARAAATTATATSSRMTPMVADAAPQSEATPAS